MFTHPTVSSSWSDSGGSHNLNFLSDYAQSLNRMGCSQLKDRVRIAYNLCHIPISFQGKVRNDDESYWIYTFLGIAAGEVEHLSLTGPPVRLWDCEGGATSWIRRSERNGNQSKKPSQEGPYFL